MKKILVTTDFSDHSKAGLHFAVQLASQNNCELTFINVHDQQSSSGLGFKEMDDDKMEQKALVKSQLVHFVANTLQDLDLNSVKMDFVVIISVLPFACIIDYAIKQNFDYLCISKRGAGKSEKNLGTVAANMINKSSIPILVVPYDDQIVEIKSVLYSSGLDDYKNELADVVSFVKPLNAALELLHFIVFPMATDYRITLENRIKKITDYPVNTYLVEKNQNDDLVESIELEVKKLPSFPSVLVMFTGKTKNWFERIFYSGNSVTYAFQTQVPLLVFNKF